MALYMQLTINRTPLPKTTMTTKTFLRFVIGSSLFFVSSASMAAEVGFGYGLEARNNTDLSHYELFDRMPLPYTTKWGDIFKMSTAIEFGAALIYYNGPDDAGTGRFSAMPMIIISPHKNINILGGAGAGFMAGQTKFGEHDLGGPFLFNAKLGLQILLGDSWGIEYTFYHQSNGNIYSKNDSLNMNQVAITFRF